MFAFDGINNSAKLGDDEENVSTNHHWARINARTKLH